MIPLGGVLLNDRTISASLGQSGLKIPQGVSRALPLRPRPVPNAALISSAHSSPFIRSGFPEPRSLLRAATVKSAAPWFQGRLRTFRRHDLKRAATPPWVLVSANPGLQNSVNSRGR